MGSNNMVEILGLVVLAFLGYELIQSSKTNTTATITASTGPPIVDPNAQPPASDPTQGSPTSIVTGSIDAGITADPNQLKTPITEDYNTSIVRQKFLSEITRLIIHDCYYPVDSSTVANELTLMSTHKVSSSSCEEQTVYNAFQILVYGDPLRQSDVAAIEDNAAKAYLKHKGLPAIEGIDLSTVC